MRAIKLDQEVHEELHIIIRRGGWHLLVVRILELVACPLFVFDWVLSEPMWVDIGAVPFSVVSQRLIHKRMVDGSLIVVLFKFRVKLDERILLIRLSFWRTRSVFDLGIQFQSVDHVQGEKHNDKVFGHLVL